MPGRAGLMTRLAFAYARRAGLDLHPVLQRAGLTVRDIEDESATLSVAKQIATLNLLAQALDDRLLGFHVARDMDLRRTGFLYYVAASSEILGEGLARIARYSGMVNEGIALATESGELPVVNADRHLNRLLINYCEDVLSRRRARSGTLRTDVENAIAASLPHGQTRIETVAQKLSVSPRTLRRRLATEGLTFAGILDDLRLALARHYLAEQDLSISRIA
jgi:hypothetical protein